MHTANNQVTDHKISITIHYTLLYGIHNALTTWKYTFKIGFISKKVSSRAKRDKEKLTKSSNYLGVVLHKKKVLVLVWFICMTGLAAHTLRHARCGHQVGALVGIFWWQNIIQAPTQPLLWVWSNLEFKLWYVRKLNLCYVNCRWQKVHMHC